MWPMNELTKRLLDDLRRAEAKAPFPTESCLAGENGTHVLFGTQVRDYGTAELALAKGTLGYLKEGMLCLADRNFLRIEILE